MEKNTFQEALARTVNDFASGDAVRHMADQGLTVAEITGRLSFPTKKEIVSEMVWKRYLENGTVLLTDPKKHKLRKISYVQEQGEYGRTSMRQVVEELPVPEGEYVFCDFGLRLYQDRDGFLRKLEGLSPEDREYILDLPWPLTGVWFRVDQRIRRIVEFMKKTR